MWGPASAAQSAQATGHAQGERGPAQDMGPEQTASVGAAKTGAQTFAPLVDACQIAGACRAAEHAEVTWAMGLAQSTVSAPTDGVSARAMWWCMPRGRMSAHAMEFAQAITPAQAVGSVIRWAHAKGVVDPPDVVDPSDIVDLPDVADPPEVVDPPGVVDLLGLDVFGERLAQLARRLDEASRSLP